VIIATGSEPNLPDHPGRRTEEHGIADRLGRHVLPTLPGLDLPMVYSSEEVLSGAAAPTGRVIVLDVNGHWEASGTAEFLADQGCDVELITPSLMAGQDLEGGTRTLFYRRAAMKHVRLRTATTVTAIEPGRVQIRPVFGSQPSDTWERYLIINGEAEWLEGIDAVVAVLGRRSREDLYHACKDYEGLAGVRIERVGDCVAPRLVESNIAEAHALGMQL
jgi:pyruvate/2-oxoglutarate dehydrogenase complex dihydrolipoamide dehydrogenase (E3) component